MNGKTRLDQMQKSRGFQASKVLSTSSQLIVPFSETRQSLVIPGLLGVNLTVAFRADAVAGAGWLLQSTTPPVNLTAADHGDLVRGPWFALVSAGTPTLVWFETHLSGP